MKKTAHLPPIEQSDGWRRFGLLAATWLGLAGAYWLAAAMYRPWQLPVATVASAHARLASRLAGEQRADEAIAESRRALLLEPENGMARYNLACFLHQAGKVADAEAELRQTLDRHPDQMFVRLKLVGVLIEQEKWDDAKRLLEAVSQEPISKEMLQQLEMQRRRGRRPAPR